MSDTPNNVVRLVPREKAAATEVAADTDASQLAPVGDFCSRLALRKGQERIAHQHRLIDDKVWPFLKESITAKEQWNISSGGAPAIKFFKATELQSVFSDHGITFIAESISRFFTDQKAAGASVHVSSGEQGIEGIRVCIRSDVYYRLSAQVQRSFTTPQPPAR